MRSERSAALHEQACTIFPGGVSHNIRYFEPYPIYVESAKGSRIRDADGNEYVDFWMNHMASLLGHAHPDVVQSVIDQVERGLHYGAPNELALDLGSKVTEYVPSAERVRFCASGTEATMYATRLARAATGRSILLKAEGGWHGGNDSLSSAIHAPFPEPQTAGLPPGIAEHTKSFPVNDADEVDRLLDGHAGDVAAIIVEPMLLAGGGVTAEDAFLEHLRNRANEEGILLIFDEVVTGFRVSPGSYQERVGITPDLTALGKAVGGGAPVGALCGRADLFERARPDADVSPEDQVIAGGGTFSMNPLTATAALASLSVVENEAVFEQTEAKAERVREGLSTVFDDLGVEHEMLGVSSIFSPHFQPEEPLQSVRAVETATNREALVEYHRGLFDHGYYFLPGHMGAVSYQTTEEELDGLIDASRTVVAELQAENVL